MSETARVSVIVLTYNRQQMLRLTLDAIRAQTFTDFEVLVVDNKSIDDTRDYVDEVIAQDRRVRYFANANGGNLSVNRNFGIAHARGEWIAFCDDDDLWEPEKLERQLAEADAHPDAGIISTDLCLFSADENGRETPYGSCVERQGDGWIERADLFSAQRTQVVLSSVLVRRAVFDLVGPWEEDPGVFAIEDLQYWIRATSAGVRIRYIDEPLVRYRIHGGNVSAPDTRVQARKQLYMVDRLRAAGVLDDAAYRQASRAFRRRARVAAVKELLKAVPGLKSAVYRERSRRHGSKEA